MEKKQAVFCLLLFCGLFSSAASRAEIALPAQPVGNATDRAVAEKETRRGKGAKAAEAAKEKAHRLAHRHSAKKKKGGRKISQAEGTQR